MPMGNTVGERGASPGSAFLLLLLLLLALAAGHWDSPWLGP